MSWMGSEGLAGGAGGARVQGRLGGWAGLARAAALALAFALASSAAISRPAEKAGGGAETALYKVRKPARGGGSGPADLVPPRPRGRGGGARARAAAYKRPPRRGCPNARRALPCSQSRPAGCAPGLLGSLVRARLRSAPLCPQLAEPVRRDALPGVVLPPLSLPPSLRPSLVLLGWQRGSADCAPGVRVDKSGLVSCPGPPPLALPQRNVGLAAFPRNCRPKRPLRAPDADASLPGSLTDASWAFLSEDRKPPGVGKGPQTEQLQSEEAGAGRSRGAVEIGKEKRVVTCCWVLAHRIGTDKCFCLTWSLILGVTLSK